MGVCMTMFTVPIAVPWDGSGGGGDWVMEDLRLTWSLPECQGCEVGGGVCGYGRNRSGVVGEITCYSDHGTVEWRAVRSRGLMTQPSSHTKKSYWAKANAFPDLMASHVLYV
ncbi:hypothetical protein SASPL_114929 [Salvia splendens]|uniref:Uncharacterized protein n=1 Tax=Salvia splendens TaxID=180675 RepID=A0A8X9A1M9_SALSN|nr:hypothetical protein SASPL_114929 [Salvia splendens]